MVGEQTFANLRTETRDLKMQDVDVLRRSGSEGSFKIGTDAKVRGSVGYLLPDHCS